MPQEDVLIPTTDGQAKGTLHVPGAGGPWPGVVMFPDAGGLRPAFREMGDHLAGLGFVALVPDVYYRAGEWAPFDIATVFSDEKERTRLFGLVSSLTNERIIADAGAYADFLLARPEVRGPAVGTTGYCMGGRIAVADDPGSPHLAADRITATVYVAGAVEDGSFTPGQAELLDSALAAAGVDHTVEFYPARHGFAVPDNDTYDPAAAGRHWEALQHLYQSRL